MGLILVCAATTQQQPPYFTANSVTNAASFVPGVTPGSLATIFGTNLTTGINGTVRADGFPMPSNLAGTFVIVNGAYAPLASISSDGAQDQIDFQVPFEAAASPTAVIQVVNLNLMSASVTVRVNAIQPGIFTLDGQRGVVVHGADNSVVTPQNPAERGEEVVIYATGLGPVDPAVRTGMPAPFSYTYAAGKTMVLFGNLAVPPDFAGLTPGLAGFFQINVRVPDAASAGPMQLSIFVNGVPSPPVVFAVH